MNYPLYRKIEIYWAKIADEVEGYIGIEILAFVLFIISIPLWFPFWFCGKIKNRKK